MQIFWTRINKIIEETDDIKTYLLNCPEDFTWVEGSFTHLGLKGFNAGDKPNRSLVRHMSICTIPSENAIGITTRIKAQRSEFKNFLKDHQVGDKVAIFKTRSNVPLRRENKNIYLLSSGVGLATFRPLVLDYFQCDNNVNHIHSLNIDSSKQYLYTDIFESKSNNNFTSQYVDNRQVYYDTVKDLATNKDGLFYIVGSDQFLKENITVLREQGIKQEQIMLDKRKDQLPEFFTAPHPVS